MGKNKHKKHHKHDRLEQDGDRPEVRHNSELKLILKVGSDSPAATVHYHGTSDKHKKKKKKKEKKKDREKEKKHKHHHKEKRKREYDEDLIKSESPPPAKRPLIIPSILPTTSASTSQQQRMASPISDASRTPTREREARTCVIEHEKDQKPLQKLLDYLLDLLEKRDHNKFFAFPVTDKFAPGYSQIIKQPMDFLSMRTKLDDGEYENLDTFKTDFELICTNAMTYNSQDTIYYKSAKKLLSVGQKILAPERIRSLREEMPFMKHISDDVLGFELFGEGLVEHGDIDVDDSQDVSKVIEDIRDSVKRRIGRFEAIPDDLSAQEILDQAKKAAKGAAEKLRLYKGESQMGFLRQKQDGSTSLSFLTGNDGVIPDTEKDRPVTLGNLIGKVKQGTGAIQGFREDRRNLAKGVHQLYYGAFSSHGPSYDSTFANLTKEETDLVYSTYGDETGVQYAESIINYSRNCDYAMFIVDHLLDILTGNEHRKTSGYVEQQKALRKEEELMNNVFKEVEPEKNEEETEIKREKIDFESLKSLTDDGIDMSFLETLKSEYEAPVKVEMSSTEKLDHNAQLLMELKQVQQDRLSTTPPQHFSQMPKPSDKEQDLAEKIQTNLTDLTKVVPPRSVIPPGGIKNIFGLPPSPLTVRSDSPSEVVDVEGNEEPKKAKEAKHPEPDSQAAHL